MVQESKYEALDRDITRAMLHAESVCLLKNKHNTPWSPVIGRATSSIRYWDFRIKRGGIRDKNDTLLKYYHELSGVGAEFYISLTIRECIHQINNARSKLKDVVINAVCCGKRNFRRPMNFDVTSGFVSMSDMFNDVWIFVIFMLPF
jgi:hypothetical protein